MCLLRYFFLRNDLVGVCLGYNTFEYFNKKQDSENSISEHKSDGGDLEKRWKIERWWRREQTLVSGSTLVPIYAIIYLL